MKPAIPLRAALEQLREFDTALLANTIGYIDPTPPHEYYMGQTIRSVTPALGPTAGVAVTCELDTSTPGGQAELEDYWRQLEQMQKMDAPAVWVVKCVGARPEHECVIGDGMGKTLRSVGCAAVVTDGGVRDVLGLQMIPMPTFSRGVTVHHCALRVRRINQPVEIGGVTVRPGDILHANAEGVIKIPHGCVSSLASRAVQMRAFEHEAHLLLRQPDFPLREKQKAVAALVERYGFSDCGTPPARRPSSMRAVVEESPTCITRSSVAAPPR